MSVDCDHSPESRPVKGCQSCGEVEMIPDQKDLPTYGECPSCGKKTVKQVGNMVVCTWPEIRKFRWWCACGFRGEEELYRASVDENYVASDWSLANNGAF